MIKIANLIMAYKEPTQVERLIKKLGHKGFDFYIHLDKKSDFSQFAYLSSLPNVYFTNTRITIYWGSYNFTEAIIKCTREILEKEENYAFVNLMSGQDYPLQSPDYIHDFFSNNTDKSFMSYEAEGSEWWRGAINRIERYHMTNFSFRGRYLLQSIINKILPKRKFPLPVTLYGTNCTTWWAINRECATYLVNYFNSNKKLQRFCSYTWAPDEFLIPTIMMNSPFKDRVVNNNLRHIDWSGGGAHPKIFSSCDLADLKNSDKLFARKFDINVDAAILDKIDQILEKGSSKINRSTALQLS